MTLHPKILEAKRRSPFIVRGIPVEARKTADKPEAFISLLDKRQVGGYSMIWESTNDFGEKFVKGAWKRSIDQRGPKSNANQQIKFLRQHNQGDALALFENIEEDGEGLKFVTKELDPVDSSERVLIQLRSGTLNNFSNGFNPVWSQSEYDEKTDTIWHKECALHEISVVGLASDSMTYCFRSMKEFEQAEIELDDEVEYFIRSLRKDIQLEARNLFARQKSLYEANSSNTLSVPDEPKSKIDYNYLLKNFKE
jgi:HK97 family phage prohead protease